MKKIIKLTENDLVRLVKRVISEQENSGAYSWSSGGKPTTSNVIVCFKKKPKSGGIIYDANYIVKSIKNKYRISPLESYSGDIVYTNIFF